MISVSEWFHVKERAFDSYNLFIALFVSHRSLPKTIVNEPLVMTALFVATLAMSSKKEEADNI